jgi:hypothetical protein
MTACTERHPARVAQGADGEGQTGMLNGASPGAAYRRDPKAGDS